MAQLEPMHAAQLRDALMRTYGQPRAVEDWQQTIHIARMLDLLATWAPAVYPSAIEQRETRQSHVDDASN